MNNKLFLLFALLTIFLLGSSSSNAQGWKWFYGEPGNDQGRGLAATLDGGFIACGDFGFYNPDGVPQGYLVRTDQNGIKIWEQAYDSTGSLFEVIQFDDSTFVAAGKRNNKAWVLGVDAWGNELWNAILPNSNTGSRYTDLKQLSDSTFLAAGNQTQAGCNCEKVLLTRYDKAGNLLWSNIFGGSGSFYVEGLEVTTDGYYLVTGWRIGPGGAAAFLIKIDENGNLIWHEDILDDPNSIDISYDVIQTADNNYLLTGQTDTSTSVANPIMFVLKTDQNGTILWEYYHPTPELKSIGYSLYEKANQNVIVTGTITENIGGNAAALTEITPSGTVLWEETYDWIAPVFTWGADLVVLPDEKIVVTGSAAPNGHYELLLFKTDSLGVLFSNEINGSIFFDENLNCAKDNPEVPMEGWIVNLAGDETLYTVTDTNGDYSFTVDTGNYAVSATYPNPYWEACNDSIPVSIPAFYTTIEEDFPMQAVVDCPYLWVDISTPFLRRCFPNTYYLDYCNLGPVTEDSVHIEVTFDQWLSVDSSSVPWTNVNGNTYTFDIGTLAFGECGVVEIYTYLDCDSTVLGQTHCVEAHIFPDSLCLPIDPLWSGASLEVSAECDGDSILFEILNAGQGDMQNSEHYIIIEDHVMLQSNDSNFQLTSGESIQINIPANGSTFRLEVPQEEGHPGFSMPAVTVEGCDDGSGMISLGYVTQYVEDDANPFISIDCQENIGAYDPNDKMGYPKGYMEDHLIEANTDIEYKIRFQNTGTDTAFRVVILDTLSTFLDPASIVPGASSHRYEFDILGSGILQFTFNDIMLPDSNVNEPASHGFVKFRISQQPDLPDGTEIFNDAAIYFDFNEPIITNTTVHRIGEGFIMVSVDPEPEYPEAQLQVSPNPFSDYTTFSFENLNNRVLNFEVYDQSGRIVRTHTFRGNSFEFHRNGLPAGLYFFRVFGEDGVIGSGKMVVY